MIRFTKKGRLYVSLFTPMPIQRDDYPSVNKSIDDTNYSPEEGRDAGAYKHQDCDERIKE